jgi:nicotinamide-nucleotide amidase
MSRAPAEPPSDAELSAAAARVAAALLAAGATIATAESCTGGWIAKVATDLPGSSVWFRAGFVTYSNAAKVAMLGVGEGELAEHGAVSEPVVRAMAAGAKRRAGTDLAVAVSGIAGPDGGSAEKPVGTVWLAWATPAGLKSERCLFAGERDAVRRHAVGRALEGLVGCLGDSLGERSAGAD